MTTEKKKQYFGHPTIAGKPQTQFRVRTPRFRCNAPLAWLMWQPQPTASAVHRPQEAQR